VPPSVFFVGKYFIHPLVDYETGLLDLTPEFPDWSCDGKHNAVFVLNFIKRLFYDNECFTASKSPLNKEIHDMVLHDKKRFLEQVHDGTKASIRDMFQNEPSCSLRLDSEASNKQILKAVRSFSKTTNATINPHDAFISWFTKEYIPQNFVAGSDDSSSDQEAVVEIGTTT